MPLRLRIWAWALIAGFGVLLAISFVLPSSPPGPQSVQDLVRRWHEFTGATLAYSTPFALLFGSFWLMRERQRITDRAFTLPQIILYSVAVICGFLPAIICIVALVVAVSLILTR